MSDVPPRRPSLVEVGGIVLAAAAVRLLFLWFYRSSPFFEAPILDSAFHRDLAAALAAGDWDAGAPYFRPPLYPWLLALAQKALGAGPWAGRLLNAAAGVALAVAVLLAGGRLSLRRPWRVGAALGAALYAPALFLEGELLGAPVATALLAGGLVAVLAGWRGAPRNGWRPWVAGALFWAAAALARGPLVLLPAVAFVLALVAPGARWRRAAGVLLATLAVWSGPALIMASHGAGLRFPATQGGINFYLGNHAGADGRGVDTAVLGDAVGWPEFAEASVREAATRTGRSLTAVEASRFWMGEGLSYWRADPLGALSLTLRKGLYLVHGYETPNNRSLYAAREDVPWLGALLWSRPGFFWPSGLLIPLAACGLWTVRRRREWVPVAATVAAVLLPLTLFFVCARFRLPALPGLLLLAAVGTGALIRRSRAAWVIFLVVYLVANLPWAGAVRSDPARDHLARGESALNAGRLLEARRSYEAALRADSGEGRARLGLAVAAERHGDLARARAEVEAAAVLLPDHWGVLAAWARILDRQGHPQEAVRPLSRAVEIYPESAALWGTLGLTLEAVERHDAAHSALEKAASRGSLDPEAWNSLGRYRLLRREREGALAAWNRALDLDANHYKALANRGLFFAQEGLGAEAVRDLEAALAAAPTPEAAQQVREALGLVRSRLP